LFRRCGSTAAFGGPREGSASCRAAATRAPSSPQRAATSSSQRRYRDQTPSSCCQSWMADAGRAPGCSARLGVGWSAPVGGRRVLLR
jgi:hypothetical protein